MLDIKSMIPYNNRRDSPCFFCGTNKSVKYVTEIIVDGNIAKRLPGLQTGQTIDVCCCNRCILTGP